MLDFQQFNTERDYECVNIYNWANSQGDRNCGISTAGDEICEVSGALEDMSTTRIESAANQWDKLRLTA